jgi:hypothetical protein
MLVKDIFVSMYFYYSWINDLGVKSLGQVDQSFLISALLTL